MMLSFDKKRSIKGAIDTIEDMYLVGWAYDHENPQKRLVVIVYVDGKLVDEGLANQFREDLLKAGIGDGRCGFRIKLPAHIFDEKAGVYTEFVIKVEDEIICSKQLYIPEKKRKIEGSIDHIIAHTVVGWAWDFENPDKKLLVLLHIDGEIVAEGFANQYRKDLKDAGIGDGQYGFIIEIPKRFLDDKEHTIKVTTENDTELKNSPLKQKLVRVFGIIEEITSTYIKGWAIDLIDPFKLLTLNLIVADKPISRINCNQQRDDILNHPVVSSLIKGIPTKTLPIGFRFIITKKLREEISSNEEVCFKIATETMDVISEKSIRFSIEDKISQRIAIKVQSRKDAAELQHKISKERDVKLIAFYLPQFYPFAENNEWWGEGFTEWNQIISAKPLFEGHYQPRLPADLGFYDLRIREVREKQQQLAKEYGIYGFCYYYYWFSGNKLMDDITEDILRSGIPDIPFCLCWANEPWTRRWDGSEHEVLMHQFHDLEHDERFIIDIMPYLKDSRYILIEGKPLIIIYNVERIPQPSELFKRWREFARQEGFPDIHIVVAKSFGVKHPYPYGADAAVEFPPHQVISPEITKDLIKEGDSTFTGHIFDYREVVAREIVKTPPPYTLYRTLMTGWDNSPRRGSTAHIFHHSSAEYYEIWLRHLIDYTRKNLPDQHRLIFINAWNEWAESTYLEPDRKHGKAFLNATKRALNDNISMDLVFKEIDIHAKNCPQIELILRFMKEYLYSLKNIYSIMIKNLQGAIRFNQTLTGFKLFNYHETQFLRPKQIRYMIERINQFPKPKGNIVIEGIYNPLEITGWLAFGTVMNFYTYILLSGDTNNFIAPIKNRFVRADVNQYLNITPNYPSGFSQYFDLSPVSSGEYTVKFLLTDGDVWYEKKTDVNITIFKIGDQSV